MYEISGSSLPSTSNAGRNNSEKSRVVNAKYSATLGGKLLKVENNNGSSFVMAMPRGDSFILKGWQYVSGRTWSSLIRKWLNEYLTIWPNPEQVTLNK